MLGYLGIIYNYISAHVSGAEDVKDIVQETMLSIWQSLKGFEKRSSFKTWCLSITKRRIADCYKKAYKNPSMPLCEAEAVVSARSELDCINDKLTVGEAKAVLDEKEKEIVFLVFNAQLSYAEVSKIMDIPVGTIKSRMSAIKAKLKRQLEKGGRV